MSCFAVFEGMGIVAKSVLREWEKPNEPLKTYFLRDKHAIKILLPVVNHLEQFLWFYSWILFFFSSRQVYARYFFLHHLFKMLLYLVVASMFKIEWTMNSEKYMHFYVELTSSRALFQSCGASDLVDRVFLLTMSVWTNENSRLLLWV